jgi:hypothetical protein
LGELFFNIKWGKKRIMVKKFCFSFMNDTELKKGCRIIFKTESRRRRFCGFCEQKLLEMGITHKEYMKKINEGKK